jgi:hypothetical protein
MKPLALEDLFTNEEHVANRDVWRKRIIRLRRDRRIAIGPDMSGSFENRELVHWQIQEMCRAEKITEARARRHELETYNPLIPGTGCLSMTLMVEIDDPARRLALLRALKGFEHHVCLEVAGERAAARSEMPEDDVPKTPAVHFLKFELTPAQLEGFRGDAPAAIVVDHDAYRAEAPIEGDLRRVLAEETAA